MKLWVGGATGFLGAALVRRLRASGHEVTAVARGGGRVDDVDVARVDVLDRDAVTASARGAEGAFLAAGKVSRDPADAEELHRIHVEGTRNALDGLRAAGVRRVVYAGTSGTIAVGTDPHRIFDETAEAPIELLSRWPYYRTKLYAEREALERNAPSAFEVVVVNPSLLLGPGDLRGSSTGDVRRFLEGGIPAIPAGGISFVDVRDVAVAMLAAFEKGRAGERYLLTAKNMTVAAFFERLERVSGVRGPRLRLPKSPALAVGANELFAKAVRWIGGEPPVDTPSVEIGQHFWYCDASKAERELGFSPRDPGDTLRDTVNDLLGRGAAFKKAGGA